VGSNVVYIWDFGDGAEVSLSPTRGDVNTTHTYTAPGTYTAIVTARNGQGTVTAQTTVVVNKRVGYVVYLPLVRK
jgi:PKD repeat protein